MNKIILGLMLCAILSITVYADAEKVLQNLQENLSQIKTVQSGFVQEKYLAIFNDKLILKGRIYLEKPQNFSWRLDTPMEYSMVIKKDKIRQWDNQSNQVQEISLADNPVFNVIVVQVRQWLYGDYAELLKDYSVAQLGDSPIVLEFIPKQTSASRDVISKIIVSFREDERYIKEIEIEEKNGDRTILKFINTRINDPINKGVWKVK